MAVAIGPGPLVLSAIQDHYHLSVRSKRATNGQHTRRTLLWSRLRRGKLPLSRMTNSRMRATICLIINSVSRGNNLPHTQALIVRHHLQVLLVWAVAIRGHS